MFSPPFRRSRCPLTRHPKSAPRSPKRSPAPSARIERYQAKGAALIADPRINSRSEVLPAYRVGAPVVCAPTSSVGDTGLETVGGGHLGHEAPCLLGFDALRLAGVCSEWNPEWNLGRKTNRANVASLTTTIRTRLKASVANDCIWPIESLGDCQRPNLSISSWH